MLKMMMHEQFYNLSTYINESMGVYIGGVCIKEAFPDCMPILNEKKDIVMFFSGECFPDTNVISDLKSKGHEFTPGDASYLIHLYEEQNEEFFCKLNGWFSGIIVDCVRSKVTLFNDRYGMQRIYYYEKEGTIIFSSEAKSLLKAFPFLRDINPISMGEYFNYDCVLKNKTFFSSISLLPGGSAWCFNQGGFEKKSYFEPGSLEKQHVLTPTQFLEQFGEIFKKILPRYFSGDFVGMALTGGLDTRMILACINPQEGTLPCYTFGGMYRDSIDIRVARRIAAACNQSHQVLRLDRNFLSEFPSNAEKTMFISDGLANVTNTHEIYLNKLCRDIAPVKMTGKFGSQVMRRLMGLRDRFPNEELIHKDFTIFISKAKKTFSEIKEDHPLSFFLFSEIPWYWAGFTSVELSQLMVRSPFLDNELVSLLFQAPPNILSNSEFQLDFIGKVSPRLRSIITDKGEGGKSFPLAPVHLKLAYKYLGLADKIYTWDRVPYSMHHLIARLDHLVSPIHAERLVRGFGYFVHYRTWFRDELANYLKEMTLDNRTLDRPYWKKKFVEKIISDHLNGRGNYLNEIRKILTVELIHRILVEDI